MPEYREYLERLAEKRAQEFEHKAQIAHDRGNLTLEATHKDMARRFRDEGIVVCKAVTSQTSPGAREKILYDHKAGKVLMISGVRIPQQGLDNPRAEVLIRTDPLYSPWRVKQLGGRVLRRSVTDPADVAYTNLWDDKLGDAKFARMFELKDNIKLETEEGTKRTEITEELSFADVMDPNFVMPGPAKNAARRLNPELEDKGAKDKDKKDKKEGDGAQEAEGDEKGKAQKPVDIDNLELPEPHLIGTASGGKNEMDLWATDVPPQKLMERSREQRARLGSPLPSDKGHWLNDVAIAQMLGFASTRGSVLEVINMALETLKSEKKEYSFTMPISRKKIVVNTQDGIAGPHRINDMRSYYIEPKLFNAIAEKLGQMIEAKVPATRIEKRKDFEKQHLVPVAMLPVYAEDMGVPSPSIATMNGVAATVEKYPEFYYRAKATPQDKPKVIRGIDLVSSFFDVPYNCRQVHPNAVFSIIEAAKNRESKAAVPADQSFLIHDGFPPMLKAAEVAKVLNVGEDKVPFIEKMMTALADGNASMDTLDPAIKTRIKQAPDLVSSFLGGNIDVGGRGNNKDSIGGREANYSWSNTLTKSDDVASFDLTSQPKEDGVTGFARVPIISREVIPFIARMLDVPPPPFNGANEWWNAYDILAQTDRLDNIDDVEGKVLEKVNEFVAKYPAKDRLWRGPFLEQGPDGPFVSYRLKPADGRAIASTLITGIDMVEVGKHMREYGRSITAQEAEGAENFEKQGADILESRKPEVVDAVLSEMKLDQIDGESEFHLSDDKKIELPPARVGMETARTLLVNELNMRIRQRSGENRDDAIMRMKLLEGKINRELKRRFEGDGKTPPDPRIEIEKRSHVDIRYYFPGHYMDDGAMVKEICDAVGLGLPVPHGYGGPDEYFAPSWLKTIMPGMKVDDPRSDDDFARIIERVRLRTESKPPGNAPLLLEGFSNRGHNATHAMPLVRKSLIGVLKEESALYFRDRDNISEYEQGKLKLDDVASWVRSGMREEERGELYAFLKKLSEDPDRTLVVAEPIDMSKTGFAPTWKKLGKTSREAKISELITIGENFDSTKISPVMVPYICLALNIDMNTVTKLTNDRKCLFPPHDKVARPWGRNENRNYTVVDGAGAVAQVALGDSPGGTKRKLDHSTLNSIIAAWLKEDKRIDVDGVSTPVSSLVTLSPELSHDGKVWQDGKVAAHFSDLLLKAIETEVATAAPGKWSAKGRK